MSTKEFSLGETLEESVGPETWSMQVGVIESFSLPSWSRLLFSSRTSESDFSDKSILLVLDEDLGDFLVPVLSLIFFFLLGGLLAVYLSLRSLLVVNLSCTSFLTSSDVSLSSNVGELVINVFSTSSSSALSFVESIYSFISAPVICLWYSLDSSSHVISEHSSKVEGNSALGLQEDWEVSINFSISFKGIFERESNWSFFLIILMSLSQVSAVLGRSSRSSFPNFAATPKSVLFFSTSLWDENLSDFLIPAWGLSFLQSHISFPSTTILSLVTLSLDDLKG